MIQKYNVKQTKILKYTVWHTTDKCYYFLQCKVKIHSWDINIKTSWLFLYFLLFIRNRLLQYVSSGKTALIFSLIQVLVTLDHLERVSTFQEFVQIFSQFGNEMVEFAHLTGDRQNVSSIWRCSAFLVGGSKGSASFIYLCVKYT